ncbi:MAG: hypothetical protein SH856_01705 [Flavobacteriales bacterium]|nr:hypothetical protein [Flavobacteriales bacterium]
MKQLYAFLFLAVVALGATSQLVVDNSLAPAQIIEDVFLANGIFVSNVTFNG